MKWNERLSRLPANQIDVERPLSDLGLDSLMSTEFFAQIEKAFGTHLPLATLIKAPTIAALTPLLSEAEDDVPTVSWDSLVEIEPGKEERPVFFVHAEEGNVLFYRDLARRLAGDRPFYGLQAQGLDGQLAEDVDISEMATHYVEEIRSVQPHGPYLLGGFCLGGALALEMGRQLQAEDEEVDEVVMIQTSHHDYIRAAEKGVRRRLFYSLVDRLDYEGFRMSGLTAGEKVAYLGNRALRAAVILGTKLSKVVKPLSGRLRRVDAYYLEALARSHQEAFWRYRPEPYDGHVVIVRASRQPRGIDPDPTMGWGPLLKGTTEVITVDAYHQTIMEDPQTQALAEQLRPYLGTGG